MTSSPTPSPAAPQARRVLTGIHVGVVVSDRRDKSRTVAVTYQVRHPKYGKYLRRRTKYQVHDEKNASKVGDRVEIANCRPVSKTKNWRLVRVVSSVPTLIEHVTEVKPS